MTAEERIMNLLQGFKVILFDTDNDKSGIVSQKFSSEYNPQEIDAIAFKDNTIILVNIYDGIQQGEIDNKFKPFFRNLNYLNEVDKLKLLVANEKTARGKENKRKIQELMEYISNSTYQFILIKLGFCPNLHVSPGKISLPNSGFIIDKKHYKYFDYAVRNIGYTQAERELFYFLRIKKRLINLPKGSLSGDKPALTSNFPALETQLDGKQVMYSARVSVNDIIEFVQVLRIADEYNVKAFQRMVNGRRLRELSKEYLARYQTFPNNIILAFNPDLYDPNNTSDFIQTGEIRFYQEYGSLIIIDGQHRLLSHLIDPRRDINKPVFINVILFKNKATAYEEMAKLFYIINTKQKKLVSLVSLKIRSRIAPDSLEGMWYRIFESLNVLHQRDNYLYNKISFEEKEIREDANKINISSIIQYSGIKRITFGASKNGRNYIGLNNLGRACVSPKYSIEDFYKNFIRKYLSIIGEILGSSIQISSRDLGGLLRLIFHFINDNRTKDIFRILSNGRVAIPNQLKQEINKYLVKISFSKLSLLDYGANDWASMEGFFIGCIRKYYRGFGINILSKKGKRALVKGKKSR